ncbi:uncharacterized protein LOC144744311 [Ciona intestinalis]
MELIAESGIPQRPITPGHQRNLLQVDQDDPRVSYSSTLVGSLNISTPPPTGGIAESRPSSRRTTSRSLRSSNESRTRQLPLQHETSILNTEASGRNIKTPVNDYIKAFSSRPKLPRTPDVYNSRPQSAISKTPRPPYSTGEPSSSHSSSSSWKTGSKSSNSLN